MHSLVVLVSFLVAAIVFAQSAPPEVMDAAIQLKKAHVDRSWQDCKLQGATDQSCKEFLQVLHKQELKVLARLAPALSDPAVNVNQLNHELTACYDPSSDYADLIRCWKLLADRLDAARKGQFLLKR